jgi:hypothetical protein
MTGLLRGFLGGLIAAATMAGGLRAIGRGDKLPSEGLIRGARLALAGMKGGSKAACPPKGSMHHLAKCPICGRRGREHEPA